MDHPRLYNMQTGLRKWAFECEPLPVDTAEVIPFPQPESVKPDQQLEAAA